MTSVCIGMLSIHGETTARKSCSFDLPRPVRRRRLGRTRGRDADAGPA
jgi:hypothetical protein